jgi:hypothetical protein
MSLSMRPIPVKLLAGVVGVWYWFLNFVLWWGLLLAFVFG